MGSPFSLKFNVEAAQVGRGASASPLAVVAVRSLVPLEPAPQLGMWGNVGLAAMDGGEDLNAVCLIMVSGVLT